MLPRQSSAWWIFLFLTTISATAAFAPQSSNRLGGSAAGVQQNVLVSKKNNVLTRKGSIRVVVAKIRQQSTSLFSRPQDNLVSGIAEIGIGFALGVLWSEYFVAITGCGPPNFSDTLERICYQGVIVVAGMALFNRIVTRKGLEESVVQVFGPLEYFTLIQVQIAEYASALAVIGAFVALGFQYSRGADMDGLSGIDVAMCRAIRDM